MVKLRISNTLILFLVCLVAVRDLINPLACRNILVKANGDSMLIEKTEKTLGKLVMTDGANRKDALRGRRMIGLVPVVDGKAVAVLKAAHQSARRCRHGGVKKLSLGCEPRERVLPTNGHHHFVGSSIPFTSDYHIPKNHPPKNN